MKTLAMTGYANVSIKHYLTLMVLGFLLSACGDFKPVSNIYDLPYASPPNAPPEYKKGWEDGCKSGFSAYGNDVMKTFYHFQQDINSMRNTSYVKAWSDSFNYCRSFVNRLQGGSGKKVALDEAPAAISGKGMNIRATYDQRGRFPLQEPGLNVPLFEGMELPGWGTSGWGKNVPCSTDWLGRMPEGCGWMGYGE